MPALTAAKIKRSTTAAWQKLPRDSSIDLVSFDGGLKLCDRNSDSNAAWEILAQSTGAMPAAYLGDDFSDEEGFAAVGENGLSVLVRPALRPTAADIWIRPPRELIGFLQRWNQAMRSGIH